MTVLRLVSKPCAGCNNPVHPNMEAFYVLRSGGHVHLVHPRARCMIAKSALGALGWTIEGPFSPNAPMLELEGPVHAQPRAS